MTNITNWTHSAQKRNTRNRTYG